MGSAFVISTWAALKDAFGQEAPLRTIPQPQACVDNAFNMSAVFEVPAVEVPGAPPVATGDFDRRGVAVQQAYPPRGVLPLLPAHLERHPDTMTTADCLVMQVRSTRARAGSFHICATPYGARYRVAHLC